jgi:hypothetical protein
MLHRVVSTQLLLTDSTDNLHAALLCYYHHRLRGTGSRTL